MRTAIVLYPDFTALDVVGPYQTLVGLPGADVALVADTLDPVMDDRGTMAISPTATFADVRDADIVVVPGGTGATQQRDNADLHDWLRSIDESVSWMTSVCTGSLVLAAAGLLAGRRATSHWLALDDLGDYGAVATEDRVVIDGHYITGAGVSAGIDMSLRLAAIVAGDDAAQRRQLAMEYAPEPPFTAGSPRTAPPAIVAELEAHRSRIVTGR